MQTNQSGAQPLPCPITSLFGILHPGSPSTCQNQPRARYWTSMHLSGLINPGITVISDTQGQLLCPIVCWSYPKLPVLSCSPSLTLASSANHNKGSCPQLPLPLPLKGAGATPCSLHDVACHLSWDLGIQKNTIFNSSHFPICWPIIIILNNNKLLL